MHAKQGAGEVRSQFTRKESNRVSIFFGVAIASYRNCRHAFLFDLLYWPPVALCLVLVQKSKPIGCDPAGQDHVDGDTVLCNLARKSLRPAEERHAECV